MHLTFAGSSLPMKPLLGPLLFAVVAACAPAGGPSLQVHTLSTPVEGPCPSGESTGDFGDSVSSFVATITGPGIEAPLRGEGVDSVVIENVPAGLGRIIALFGLEGTAPRWRGVSSPTETKAGEDTPVDILLGKVASLSCARSDSREKRVFHTATLLDNGDVLVVGGAKELRDISATCGGCKAATATSSASLYNPRTGTFTVLPPLSRPRMFHTAVKMADGRVVISGGSAGAVMHTPRIDAGFPFPIEPEPAIPDVEVYDPGQQVFTSGGSNPALARVFAAATTLLTGEALITGGIPGAGTPKNDLSNALSTTMICGGDPLNCVAGPNMAAKRAGHHAFTFDPEGVFLWGGSVDFTTSGTTRVPEFRFEALQSGQPNFAFAEVCEMTKERNVFFAGGATYNGSRFLSAGGLFRDVDDGSFHALLDGEQQGSAVLVYDLVPTGNGCATSVTNGVQGARMNIKGTRFFAAAAGLPDRESAVIAGGFVIPADFNDVSFTAAPEVEIYLQDGLVIDDLSSNDVPLTMRDSRGGATATSIGDGTVVIIGGASDDGALETAEIFATREAPPQAAGFAP